MNGYAIILLSTGLIYLVCGYIFKKYPPKKMNGTYGYRSGKAMNSQKAWDLTQPYFAKILLWQGVIMVAIGLPAMLIPVSTAKWAVALEAILPIAIILFGVAFMIYKTDKYVESNI